MGTGFAGSQRGGDRRRRRLAVEADDFGSPGALETLRAPSEPPRRTDPPHSDQSPEADATSLSLPLARLVPTEWWKYVAGGISCAALAALLVIAGQRAAGWSGVLGTEFSRLFIPPAAPVARWFSSVLMTLSAQLACLIWWCRSKSEKDFEGRYWLWGRIAGVWFCFGGSIATGVHEAIGGAVSRLWPRTFADRPAAGWLIPAALAGAWITRALSREMSGCRWSRGMLCGAAVAYLTAGGLVLEIDCIVPAGARIVLLESILLAGHVGLFLSMWLHARHVVHCTCDPSRQERRWRLPRPHFRLFRVRPKALEQTASVSAAIDEAPSPAESKRKRSARRAPQPTDDQVEAATPGPAPAPTAKSRYRIDSRHEEPFVASGSAASPARSAEADAATKIPSSASDDARRLSPAPVELEQFSSPAVPIELAAEDRDRAAESPEEPSDSDESSPEPLAKPDLRGLSKKQRRKLMQELRQRERETGR